MKLLVWLSLLAGCAAQPVPPRVVLQAPAPTADFSTRLDAYHALKPAKQIDVYSRVANGVYVYRDRREFAAALVLANGTVISNPRDVGPLVPEDAPLLLYAREAVVLEPGIQKRQRRTRIARGAVLASLGAVFFVPVVGIPLLVTTASVATVSTRRLRKAVGEWSDLRERAFDDYDDELRRRLGLCYQEQWIDCPPPPQEAPAAPTPTLHKHANTAPSSAPASAPAESPARPASP